MTAMPQRVPRYISLEEYREMELSSNIKHEYFQGELFAMAGGTKAHSKISGNIYAELHNKLRGKSCRPANSDQMVHAEGTDFSTYPDVSVYCKGARFEAKGDQVLLTPVVIFEVLSPSTEGFDRGKKFDFLKPIATFTDYVLVSQENTSVDHFHRLDSGDWLLHTAKRLDDSIVLDSIGVTLQLGEIYDDVEVPPALELLRAPVGS